MQWPLPRFLNGKGKKIGSYSYALAFGSLSVLLIQALQGSFAVAAESL